MQQTSQDFRVITMQDWLCNVSSCFVFNMKAFGLCSFSDLGASIRVKYPPASASLKAAHCSLFRQYQSAPAAYKCLGQWAQHTGIPNNSFGQKSKQTCSENMGKHVQLLLNRVIATPWKHGCSAQGKGEDWNRSASMVSMASCL